MPPSAPSPSSVLRPRSSSHPTGPCPSPSDRRRQSPNGSPPPERARDRCGRRGVAGEECGGVSAGGMAVAPPGRRRAFRVRSPTAPPDAPERRAQAADSRSDENRSPGVLSGVPKRPSHSLTEADSRPRGVGQMSICRSRVRARIRPVRMRCRGGPDKPPSRSMPSCVLWPGAAPASCCYRPFAVNASQRTHE